MNTQISNNDGAQSGASLPPRTGSANHGICKDCQHQWPQDGAPPYRPGSWCYMFRDGAFLESQGYCGQFKPENTCGKCGKKIIYSTVRLCDECFNHADSPNARMQRTAGKRRHDSR